MINSRLNSLDGWRGISISLVLAGHLIPLGPKALQANHTAAVAGMAIFFTLSGFLITSQLVNGIEIRAFLIRRILRIAPLAFTGIGLIWLTGGITSEDILRLSTFSANLPPTRLNQYTDHYWSLCLEVQFYVFSALLVGISGNRGLKLFLPACLAITLYRIHLHALVDIHTLKRADEILAGAILALMLRSGKSTANDLIFNKVPWWCIIPVFLASCHPEIAGLNFARPYLAMWLVGATLHTSAHGADRVLSSRALNYLASTSYALYIVHGIFMGTWLASGDSMLEKFSNRILLILLTFGIAHISTRYFESIFIEYAKRITSVRPSSSRLHVKS